MCDVGIVYVMSIGSFIKIGRTNNPRIRFINLDRMLEKDKKIKLFIHSILHSNYKENEKILHEKFSTDRIGYTEFFDMPPEKVIHAFSSLVFKRKNKVELPKKNISEKREIIIHKNRILTQEEIQSNILNCGKLVNELAYESGLSTTTLYKILKESYNISYNTKEKLSKYFEKLYET